MLSATLPPLRMIFYELLVDCQIIFGLFGFTSERFILLYTSERFILLFTSERFILLYSCFYVLTRIALLTSMF